MEVEAIIAAQPHVTYDSYREVHIQLNGQPVKLVSTRLSVTRDIEPLDFQFHPVELPRERRAWPWSCSIWAAPMARRR